MEQNKYKPLWGLWIGGIGGLIHGFLRQRVATGVGEWLAGKGRLCDHAIRLKNQSLVIIMNIFFDIKLLFGYKNSH